MNPKSQAFLMSLAKQPMPEVEAFALFGDKYQFENNRSKHFHTMVDYTDDWSCFCLTADGLDYVASQQEIQHRQQEMQEQHEADEAKSIRDRKQQLRHDWGLHLVSAFLGAILALIVEHFQKILTALGIVAQNP